MITIVVVINMEAQMRGMIRCLSYYKENRMLRNLLAFGTKRMEEAAGEWRTL